MATFKRRASFAVFALAVLFSMLREWRAPIACTRFLWDARTQIHSNSR
jgi:hypothetical protein